MKMNKKPKLSKIKKLRLFFSCLKDEIFKLQSIVGHHHQLLLFDNLILINIELSFCLCVCVRCKTDVKYLVKIRFCFNHLIIICFVCFLSPNLYILHGWWWWCFVKDWIRFWRGYENVSIEFRWLENL